MVRQEIFINNISVGYFPGNLFGLTRQSSKLGSVDFYVDFTTEFSLPITNELIDAIGYAHSVNTTDSKPYTSYPFQCKQNGVKLFTNAYVYVTKIEKKQIFVKAFDGTFNVMSLLKDKQLYDLVTDYLAWNITTIVNSASGTYADYFGVKFPIIDNYKLEAENKEYNHMTWDMRANDMFAAMFVKAIFESIQTSLGLTFTGNLLTDTTFEKLMFSLINKDYDNKLNQSGLLFKIFTDNQNLTTSYVNTPLIIGGISDPAGQFYTCDAPYTNCINVFCDCEMTIGGLLNLFNQFNVATVYVKLSRYSVLSTTEDILYEANETISNAPDTINIPYNTYQLKANDRIILSLKESGSPYVICYDTSYLECTYAYTFRPTYGTNFTLKEVMPSIDVLTFMKNILTPFGAMTQWKNNTVDIFTFKDIYDNRHKALDWSNKLISEDQRLPNSLDYIIEQYSQSNWIKFKKTDLDNRPSLDVYITCNNKNLPVKSDLLELFFITVIENQDIDATHTNPVLQRLENTIITGQTYGDTSDKTYFSQKWDYTESILLNDEANTDNTRQIHSEKNLGTGDIDNLTTIPNCSTVKLATLQATYLNPYLERILTNPKHLLEFFDLSLYDVRDFDFSIPIYLEKYGAYFMVINIENYMPEQLTLVELIKL